MVVDLFATAVHLSCKGRHDALKEMFKPLDLRKLANSVGFQASALDTTRARHSSRPQKLVVALGIGTTFGGAAHTFLGPGDIPWIRDVVKYVIVLVPPLATMCDKRGTGTSTIQTLGHQGFPLYRITVAVLSFLFGCSELSAMIETNGTRGCTDANKAERPSWRGTIVRPILHAWDETVFYPHFDYDSSRWVTPCQQTSNSGSSWHRGS